MRHGTNGERGADTAPDRDGIDRDWFAIQFDATFRRLWLIAAGMLGDRSLVEDVLQEAATVALGKLDEFKPGTHFPAWMGQIVRFVALNTARNRNKHRIHGAVAGQIYRHQMSRARASESNRFQLDANGQLPREQEHFDDRVIAALAGLTPVARTCLLLRTVEELDYAQISTLLGIPQGTAMSHVHRSRKYLRKRLQPLTQDGRTNGEA